MANKYKCPCCEYYTFDKIPNTNYDICPVCYWEDDPFAYDNPDYVESCNGVSLNKAKKNFVEFGACTKDMQKYTRLPNSDELRGVDL